MRPPRRRQEPPPSTDAERLATFRVEDWLEPMPGEDPGPAGYPADLRYWAMARWRIARRRAGLPELCPYTGRPIGRRRLPPAVDR